MQNYLDYVLEDSWLKTSVFIILFLLIPELESAKQKYYFSSYSCLKYKSAYLVVYSRFLTFQFTCLCVHLLLNNFETSSLGMNTTKSNYDLTLTLLFHFSMYILNSWKETGGGKWFGGKMPLGKWPNTEQGISICGEKHANYYFTY